MQSILGESGVGYVGHGYGHNFYVGLIYVGGLIFGLPVIISLFRVLLVRLSFARSRLSEMTLDDRFCLVWGLTAFAGYIGYGFLGGTFGDRAISMNAGVAVGLMLREFGHSHRSGPPSVAPSTSWLGRRGGPSHY